MYMNEVACISVEKSRLPGCDHAARRLKASDVSYLNELVIPRILECCYKIERF